MIEMYDVSVVFPNGARGLHKVNLRIAKGEFVFLVGPSGAGKSTFIRLIYREILPTSGQVYVLGRNLARLRRREVPYLRREVGVVFQDFKLLNDRTVYDNVAFALQVTGASPREVRKRVPAVLEMVGLAHKATCYPDELAGGEQQRVSVARAIANNPRIVLADEPTGNLDPDTARGIVELLLDINRLGATVVVATHALDIVSSHRQRVVELRDGRVVRDVERGLYRRAL